MSDKVITETGRSVLIESLVYRYAVPILTEHDTVQEAQSFIDSGEDAGEHSSVGVFVDGEPHSVGPWDWVPAGQKPDWRLRGGETVEELRREYVKAKGPAAIRKLEHGS